MFMWADVPRKFTKCAKHLRLATEVTRHSSFFLALFGFQTWISLSLAVNSQRFTCLASPVLVLNTCIAMPSSNLVFV